jgi:hypothetical protein
LRHFCPFSGILDVNQTAKYGKIVKMKPPKKAETRALIERLNIYLRDNPTCKLEDAARILNIQSTRVRKWKQFGWIEHQTEHQAKRARAEEASRLLGTKPPPRPKGRPKKQPPPTPEPAQQEQPKTKQNTTVAGEVASSFGSSGDVISELDLLIAKGQNLKISQLRSLIKAHLMANVHDSKSVSNYAAGLKALSGVQDVELEDIYENEQLMKIYVPAEDSMRSIDVVEVDKIEY